MNSIRSFCRLIRPALVALPLALLAAGCDNFGEKETPLKGDRRPLFPEGVPGVQFGARPQQPTNSNVPIPSPSAMSPEGPEGGPPPPQSARPAQKAQPAPPAAKSAKASKSGDPNDAWSGTR